MSAHLLAVSIGPVQDFIAAARRTRDLWFGSYVLSEVSKAAAQALRAADAELIFPAPDADLAPHQTRDATPPVNVANKILARLSAGVDPRAIAQQARGAAQQRWQQFAGEVLELIAEEGVLRMDIWNDQVGDVIEFYAAWVPVHEQYTTARQRVDRLLAGRKALRDFAPARGYQGVPKSSLDGARESVLSKPDKFNRTARRKARLRQGEQLDVVGLVKRLAGNPDTQFVSVSRVAADPWVRAVAQQPGALEQLQAMDALCPSDVASRIWDPTYATFPREGNILFASRYKAMRSEWEEHASDLDDLHQALLHIERNAAIGAPSPYFAVLLADGDRMGATISSIELADAHQGFSRQLSQFAAAARDVVRNHHGSLVYSGGDDVLAFLPLDTCLQAAWALHESFAELMDGVAAQVPTLSVGISIAHCMEPLEILLDLARKAEKDAKQGTGKHDERDGLAVHLTTRGGEATRLRDCWKERPDLRLQDWVQLHLDEQVPDKAAYDMRQMAMEYGRMQWKDQNIDKAIQADVKRLLKKKRDRQSAPLDGPLVDRLLERVESSDDLLRLASELIIARRLASVVAPRHATTTEESRP